MSSAAFHSTKAPFRSVFPTGHGTAGAGSAGCSERFVCGMCAGGARTAPGALCLQPPPPRSGAAVPSGASRPRCPHPPRPPPAGPGSVSRPRGRLGFPPPSPASSSCRLWLKVCNCRSFISPLVRRNLEMKATAAAISRIMLARVYRAGCMEAAAAGSQLSGAAGGHPDGAAGEGSWARAALTGWGMGGGTQITSRGRQPPPPPPAAGGRRQQRRPRQRSTHLLLRGAKGAERLSPPLIATAGRKWRRSAGGAAQPIGRSHHCDGGRKAVPGDGGGDVIGCKQIERGRARRDVGCALRRGPPSAPGRRADSGSANARRCARPRAVSGESSDTSARGGPAQPSLAQGAGRCERAGGGSAGGALAARVWTCLRACPPVRLRARLHAGPAVPHCLRAALPLLPTVEPRWVPASQPAVPSLLCLLLTVSLVLRGAPRRGQGAKPRCWAVRGAVGGSEPKGRLLVVGRAFPRGRIAALGTQKYPFWSFRRFLRTA